MASRTSRATIGATWNSCAIGTRCCRAGSCAIQHEDVVEDLEGNVRRILDFCGLDFEPACLEFYKTERSVRTASSEQVRRPIYKEGLDQWRNFEPWLGTLEGRAGRPLARSAEMRAEGPPMAYD